MSTISTRNRAFLRATGAVAGALAGTVAAATLSVTPALAAKPRPSGEEQLAKMLEGRVAGEPVHCISANPTSNTTVIDRTAIVYRIGSTLYVNRPKNADRLDSDDILVTKMRGSQLCSIDIVELRERTPLMMYSGFVNLGEFVPYRKAAAKD